MSNTWIVKKLSTVDSEWPIYGIALDNNGNIYFTMGSDGLLRLNKDDLNMKPQCIVKDGSHMTGIVWNGNNILYICGNSNNRILSYSIDTGTLSILAGNGKQGHQDGNVKDATFAYPWGIAMDRNGDLYITEYDRIRKVNIRSGTVETIAGPTGSQSDYGYQDGETKNAKFYQPNEIAISDDGTIYVCDCGNYCIRQIKNGVVSTLAGTPGTKGYKDGTLRDSIFSEYIQGLAMTDDGSLLVADKRLRKVDIQVSTPQDLQVIKYPYTLTTNGKGDIYCGTNTPSELWKITSVVESKSSLKQLASTFSIALKTRLETELEEVKKALEDSKRENTNLLNRITEKEIAITELQTKNDELNRSRRQVEEQLLQQKELFATELSLLKSSLNNAQAQFRQHQLFSEMTSVKSPEWNAMKLCNDVAIGLCVDIHGQIYFTNNSSAFHIDPVSYQISPLTSLQEFEGIIGSLSGIVSTTSGMLYLCDQAKGKLIRLHDDAVAILPEIKLNRPRSMAAGSQGQIYVINEEGIHMIHKGQNEKTVLTTIVNYSTSNQQSLIGTAVGIAVDDDIIYVTDFYSDIIYMIKEGIASPLVGIPGYHSSEDGPLWSATLNGPTCVIVDQNGNLIVGTQGSLRMIDIQNNMVSTVLKCDGHDILCLALDKEGNVFAGTTDGIFKVDMSIQIGNKIEVIEDMKNGWIKAKMNEQKGLVPTMYVGDYRASILAENQKLRKENQALQRMVSNCNNDTIPENAN